MMKVLGIQRPTSDHLSKTGVSDGRSNIADNHYGINDATDVISETFGKCFFFFLFFSNLEIYPI